MPFFQKDRGGMAFVVPVGRAIQISPIIRRWRIQTTRHPGHDHPELISILRSKAIKETS